ncbi:ABC transporter permease [Rhodovibrionaceae bacterium A322]
MGKSSHKTKRPELLRFAPALTLLLFIGPILAGLLGTWLPGLGVLPALGGDSLSLHPAQSLFQHPSLPKALQVTLISGLGAAAISFSLVILMTAFWQNSVFFRLLRRLAVPLLAIPHAALAIGLAFLIAPSGFFLRLLSPWATGFDRPPDWLVLQDPWGLSLLLGLVVKEVPFLLLMTVGAQGQIDCQARLATARSLGYRPATAWLKTVLPAIYPQIRLPLYAVLAFSLSVVDMSLILGPQTPPTLAVLVFRWFNDPDLALRFQAAAGATLLLGIIVLAILLWRAGEALARHLGRRWLSAGHRGYSLSPARSLSAIAFALLSALGFLSLVILALWSVTRRWRYPDSLPGKWTVGNWQQQSSDLLQVGTNSLLIGLLAAGAALVLVVACLENEQRRNLTPSARGLWLLYLPLLVPQISFLFGVQVLLVWLRIDGGWLAVVWSHLLFSLPYVFLTLADPYRALDSRFSRTALCLGASPNRIFWRVKLPLLKRPLAIAFAVGFSVSIAQYLPTLFAGGGRIATLTSEAVALSGGADRRVVALFAFLQALLPLLVFALAASLSEQARPGRNRWFFYPVSVFSKLPFTRARP